MRLILLLTAVSLLGLCDASSATQNDPLVREISCEDGAERTLAAGKLVNNMWNKQAVAGQHFKQCLLARPSGRAREYGWSWAWPASSTDVLAFPQVVFGWKPWNGGATTDEALPIRIAAIRSLKLHYDIETNATGKHILSAALWFTRTGATRADANPSDISADLNIWTDVSGFSPSGVHIATVTIDGKEFEFWHQSGMGDASGGSANQWQHIVFRARKSHHAATLDIKEFIELAVKHRLLSPDHFLSSIELGNEVMAGEGQSWIRQLKLQVE